MALFLLGLIILVKLGPEAEGGYPTGDCYSDGPRSSITCDYQP